MFRVLLIPVSLIEDLFLSVLMKKKLFYLHIMCHFNVHTFIVLVMLLTFSSINLLFQKQMLDGLFILSERTAVVSLIVRVLQRNILWQFFYPIFLLNRGLIVKKNFKLFVIIILSLF